MTVAARDSFEPSAGRSALRGAGSSRSPWRRVWQVPLLVGGIALFGLGVRELVKTIKPVPFDAHVRSIQALLSGGEFAKAIDQINLLSRYYHEPRQLGELELLAGDAHFLWQQKQPVPVLENFKRVLGHYQHAVDLGIAPTPLMEERWGEAALASGDAKLAVAKLEAAVEGDPALLKTHIRELVSAYAAGGLADTSSGQLQKAQKLLAQLLAEGEKPGHDGREGEAHDPGLEAIDNRTWALCKQIEIGIALSTRGATASLERVVEQAREAVKEIPERDPSGRLLTWIGRAELEQGRVDDARRDLSEARVHFIARNLDDGRAALMLARIAESRGEYERAGELYREIAGSQAGTTIWAAARFGRAEMAFRQPREAVGAGGVSGGGGGEPAMNEQAQGDYQYAIKAVTEETPELISLATVREGLIADFQRAADADRLEEALAFLSLQKQLAAAEDLVPRTARDAATGRGGPGAAADDAALAYRFATTRERRGEELLAEGMKADPAGRLKKQAEARALFGQAAEDYLRHARLMTMDDTLSASSLWRAAQLFDRAGMPVRSIAAYEQFTIQHPRDPRVSEGLLSIGRLYQSSGEVEKAIPYYQRNMKENPRTPAAYTSAVNLARCYMTLQEIQGQAGPATAPATAAADGPFEKAEAALLSIVQNNGDILPAANEYRISLFTLGELYYRNGRWADAILRFEEAVERYPGDPGAPRAIFLLGESFRKSAADIAAAVKRDPAIAGREALENARLDRLAEAARLFTWVIGLLDSQSEESQSGAAAGIAEAPGQGKRSTPLTELEQEYVRTAYMDRAACYFDRGDYAAAIKLYDQAATRFAEEVLAVKAYVQIVNAYLALREPSQAASAAERGLWILKRIPDEAFATGPVKVGKDYYAKLLALEKQ